MRGQDNTLADFSPPRSAHSHEFEEKKMFESRGTAALKSSHYSAVRDLANGQCYGKQTSGGSFVIDGLQIGTE